MKNKIGDNLKRVNSSNRGSTMIETLVSFVVLMIILAIITGIIIFCSKLRMRAEDTSKAMTVFTAQINNADNAVAKEVAEGNAGVDVKLFRANNIKVSRYSTGKNVTKDSQGNIVSSKPVPLFFLTTPESTTVATGSQNVLSLYNIEADSYTYISSGDEDLQYLKPKALRFVHKKDR